MKKLICISAIALFFSSCTLSYDFTVTNNAVGTKKGVSEYKYHFGTIPLGSGLQDAGYQSAAKNGGITKIGLTETKVVSNGLVIKTTTTVYGN
jgi:hypothetical protein